MMAVMAMQSAKALIVSVQGEGEVPAEGMDLLITEGEEDVLSGKYTMELRGELLSSTSQVTVQIYRSASGLEDEFCCADNCTAGNGQTEETKVFQVNGLANWYSHYVPAPGSDVTVRYVFADGADELEIRVHYVYTAEGLERTKDEGRRTKELRNGQVVIRTGEKVYSIGGTNL